MSQRISYAGQTGDMVTIFGLMKGGSVVKQLSDFLLRRQLSSENHSYLEIKLQFLISPSSYQIKLQFLISPSSYRPLDA